MGTIELAIPKLRQGTHSPSFLNARKRSEQALLGVVMEAYTNGVSTRKVERLVEQLGVETMSKSHVSRICKALKEHHLTGLDYAEQVGERLDRWTTQRVTMRPEHVARLQIESSHPHTA